MDVKLERIKHGPREPYVICEECKAWCGHELHCSKVTIEGIAKLLKQSRENEQWARDRAASLLTQVRLLQGRVAMLKQENNKLRKANDKLKVSQVDL